ncbi:hypothetical protein M413DRAFT_24837 [Hebeloma cylindrosporum]|uniref:Uncharacterized protein n=1 Tax=Hebeloma cylindrosporum TaxID=76867 RepID=A0A0C2YXL0_HEBCY|nr:hypothetical protein M413DRAFT_24837 [Hebeloma cylindrosporum h7]
MPSQNSPSWDEYRRTYTTYKAQRESAAAEWDRFRNEVDSQYKLDVLRAYIAAVNREVSYRSNFWNDSWGPQDPGHMQWMENLRTTMSDLEYQEALLSHRIDTERYETIDECGPSTSGQGNRTGGGGHGGELRKRSAGNICGNPDCGNTFICTEDYNRIVRAQGYPGVS